MSTAPALRIEPSPEILDAARAWVDAIRPALDTGFVAAYLSGSVLLQGFDARRSRVNLLVVARDLSGDTLDAIAARLPQERGSVRIEPLFVTRAQIEKSLDTFPIEWLEIQERHLRLDGDDVFGGLEIPRAALRLQCEHELRVKHLQLRQAYLANAKHPGTLADILGASASGFAALFRTLVRLQGESPDAHTPHVVERVAHHYRLDGQALLGAHLVRASERRWKADEIGPLARRFVVEVDRLIQAIDALPTT